MIRFTTIFILVICFGASANDISKINQLKKNAEIAFKHQQFDVAVSNYSYLLDTLQVYDEESILNLGHAYYQLNQKDLAQAQYQKLVLSENDELKSVAYQQLGAISKDPKTLEKAMSYFKESIKSDPRNMDARYNYEMVKKRLKEQQEQNQENQDQNNENQENQDEEKKDQDQQENQDQQEGDQNQDQENQNSDEQQQEEQQEQQNQDQEGENQEDQNQEGQENEGEGNEEEQQQPQPQEGEEGEENDKDQQQQPSPSDKMQEMNISEEKAKMILEALKNSEIQYIQQNRRKPTKRKESDKPDW